jgi:uncharacterized membrane protein
VTTQRIRPAKSAQKSDLLNWLGVLLGVVFPALVYFGRGVISPQALALVLILVIGTRRTIAFGLRVNFWLVTGGLLLVALALRSNAALPLKLYPVLINGSLLCIFVLSLCFPPTVAERAARLRRPDLPPFVVAYTRNVTKAWCIFFAANALIALWTALWSSDRIWFFYNGVIAYALVGVMFAGEWFIRRRVLRGFPP